VSRTESETSCVVHRDFTLENFKRRFASNWKKLDEVDDRRVREGAAMRGYAERRKQNEPENAA
jgi:hypothetical protein